MGALRFSIVIPTRRGVNTLVGTLRTCLDQECDDYEIIVCDNDGPPEVREAVEGLKSPRIRYHRTPHLLPMTANWELALSLAQGEYVTALGNDDGLMLHALGEADRLIRETGTKLIRWERAHYNWPCHLSPIDRNLLMLPLQRRRATLDSRTVMEEVLRFDRPYNDLPMINHGLIHRSLIEEHRRRCGKLFMARSPDVYSAFSLSYLGGSYLSLDLPMFLNGSSCHSNGAAHLLQPQTSQIAAEFVRLNVENKLLMHPNVPELLYLTEPHVADAFLHAHASLYPHETGMTLDRKKLLERCVKGIRAHDLADWNEALRRIRNAAADSPELLAWVESLIPAEPRLEGNYQQICPSFRGYNGDSLYLDLSTMGVTDVYGAAQVTEKILNFRRSGIEYDLPTRHQMYLEIDGHRRHVQTMLTNQIQSLESSRMYRLAMRASQLVKRIPFVAPIARRLLGKRVSQG